MNHKHVMEDVENSAGHVIARRCVQCLVVVDVQGKRVVGSTGHTNPWQLENVRCTECNREYPCAVVYLQRRKYCRKQCRWKAAYSRRKKTRSQTAGSLQ